MKFLNIIQKYLFFFVALAIAAGLAVVELSGGFAFTPLICFLAAVLMIYPSLVPLDLNKLKNIRENYKIILLSIIFNFLLIPLLAVVIGYFFLSDHPTLWLGLLLISILPGGGMVTTWASKSKADMAATVSIVLANLLVAILVAPFFISAAVGHTIPAVVPQGGFCPIDYATGGQVSCFLGNAAGQISPWKIALPVLFIIVIPLFLAYVTQKQLKKKGEEHFQALKPYFGKFSNLGLVIILFILMSLNNNRVFLAHPDLILGSVLPLLLFYGGVLSFSLLVYRIFLRNERGKAFVWGTYLRYITLALGLTISLIYQNSGLSVMTVLVILSYFIQIPASFLVARHLSD